MMYDVPLFLQSLRDHLAQTDGTRRPPSVGYSSSLTATDSADRPHPRNRRDGRIGAWPQQNRWVRWQQQVSDCLEAQGAAALARGLFAALDEASSVDGEIAALHRLTNNTRHIARAEALLQWKVEEAVSLLDRAIEVSLHGPYQ